jgi:hypothetical protein
VTLISRLLPRRRKRNLKSRPKKKPKITKAKKMLKFISSLKLKFREEREAEKILAQINMVEKCMDNPECQAYNGCVKNDVELSIRIRLMPTVRSI